MSESERSTSVHETLPSTRSFACPLSDFLVYIRGMHTVYVSAVHACCCCWISTVRLAHPTHSLSLAQSSFPHHPSTSSHRERNAQPTSVDFQFFVNLASLWSHKLCPPTPNRENRRCRPFAHRAHELPGSVFPVDRAMLFSRRHKPIENATQKCNSTPSKL